MRVGVIGLGMAGLYQALELWHHGYRVVGYEVAADRLAAIRSGADVLPDVAPEVVARALASGRLEVDGSAGPLGGCEGVLISVPTDVDGGGKPDAAHVAAAAATVAEHCRPGVLVIVKSTAYPGMVREVVGGPLDARFGPAGTGYHLAYAPERGDPGSRTFEVTGALPKVVGGATGACADRAAALYRVFGGPVHLASCLEAAELVKLHENVFRFVNIGYVNELADLAARLGIDVGEVVDLAASKPFGFLAFHPGVGVGGMYVPVNPRYLLAAADSSGARLRTVEAATLVNDAMPETVLDRVRRTVGPLDGRSVLVLGVTYKPGSADLRRSPALAVVQRLADRAAVTVVDPYAAGALLPGTRLRAHGLPVDPAGQDVALLLVAHREFAEFLADPPIPCLDALGRRHPVPDRPGGRG